MHKILIGVAAAGVLFAAMPAFSEEIGVSVGERGVSVGVDRDHDRGVRRERGYTDGRNAHRDECREVTVKKRLPDGSVVIRKSRRC
jgi:hypothetical protein